MDHLQIFEDTEDVAEVLRLQYPEKNADIKYDKNNIAVTQKEEQETETESEVIDKTDILVDYMTEFEARRTKELPTKAKEKEEQLRQLIGEKQKDDASEETLITPEEVTARDEISTESSVYPCLFEIDISESQLKLVNPYTVYTVPGDPGLLPAFWLLHKQPPIYKEEEVQKFYDIVKRLNLKSIRSLRDMFVTDEINLRHYGLESRVIGAMCEALANNTSVQRVDLKGNQLSTEACGYLKDLLLKNNVITSLSLSDCGIGINGAKKLHDAISTNTTLKMIDLSNCNIENEGFQHIASALCLNDQGLESINLSGNHLDELCSESLRNLLSHSETLAHLDLSWNSLNTVKTWKSLINGFQKNQTLLSLNLSWNALGTECVPFLYLLLIDSQSIEKLDLSWNRFIEKDVVPIAKALSKNIILQELYLGNNPLKAQGALTLIRAITPQLSSNSALHLLDLENIWADKNILQELQMIEKTKPWLVVKLGGILSNYQLVGPNIRRILLRRANYEAMKPKRKRQRRNFGYFVMSLKDKMISQAKFIELIQKAKLKLSISLINEIMKAFEGPKHTVDQQLLKSFYLEEYPETTVAPPQKKEFQIT